MSRASSVSGHARDHQDVPLELGQPRLQRGLHGVDLDLPRAPPQRVVVRRRHPAAEDVDHEPLVHRRAHDLDADAALAQILHDLLRGDGQRRELLARVRVEDGEAARRRELAAVDQPADQRQRGAGILAAAPGDAPVGVVGAVGLQRLDRELDALRHLEPAAAVEE
jgi:hypothetical protein